MSTILQSVKIAQILGVLIAASVFMYNFNIGVKSEDVQLQQTGGKLKPASSGALIAVPDSDGNDDDDGIITEEGNGSVEEIDESLEIFKPTDDWKPVMKGQKIPPGLHVRMNLQTGEKEAKLMQQDGAQNVEQWDGGENIGIINTEKKRFTRDELKAALKDFKYKDETPPDKEEEVKKKFRSYDELKKIMEELNMTVKTETEIVTELTNELQQKDTGRDRLKAILLDLEYYLHQIDNAKIFRDLGGLKTLIHLMNSTEEDIRETATFTIGAALQSNAKVQVTAVDGGVLQQLVKMLSVDPSFLVRKKVLFALSTVLRQFPYAQKKFLQLGGLSALTELFVTCKDENLQIKIITLLTDLLFEYDSNVNHPPSDDAVQAERTRQYKEVKLQEALYESGWCGLITSLLNMQSGHDSVEKVINAMLQLISVCKDEFAVTRPKLQHLLNEYKELANEEIKEGSSDVFSVIYSTIQTLVSELPRVDL